MPQALQVVIIKPSKYMANGFDFETPEAACSRAPPV